MANTPPKKHFSETTAFLSMPAWHFSEKAFNFSMLLQCLEDSGRHGGCGSWQLTPLMVGSACSKAHVMPVAVQCLCSAHTPALCESFLVGEQEQERSVLYAHVYIFLFSR